MFHHKPHDKKEPDTGLLDERYLYHCASEYRDRGWSVIPLHGKKPAIPTWNEFRKRAPTLGEIAVWFGGSIAESPSLGIVTGQYSGLVVIDCDSSEDAQYWLGNFTASPLKVHTGGGGVHVYYRMPECDLIGNRTRLFGRMIDVRGEGGYVCAPPSRHANGSLYQWESWGDYCLDVVPFLDPNWLRSEPSRISISTRTGASNAVRDATAYIRKIRAIAGQNGHNATYRAACVLRESGLSPEETLAELIEWNETNCEPKWSIRELLHKTQSAFARSQKDNPGMQRDSALEDDDSPNSNSKVPT